MEKLPSKPTETPTMFQMITAKSSKTALIRQFSDLSVPALSTNKPTSIAGLIKEHGQEVIENCVAVLVADLNTSFSGELAREQIEEIVVELTSGFNRNHSLESIYLACRRLKTSESYKLTVAKVLREADAVINEITEAVIAKNYEAHMATKFYDPRPTAQEQRKKEREANSIANIWHEINQQTK